MNSTHISRIAQELNISARQVSATAELLSEGATVPFISRYRKEATGSLDEVAVTDIRDRLEQLEVLDKRREAILKSLVERELLTPQLKNKIDDAENITVLEDLYLPFRPKRRTKATIAREAGLEPLALWIQEAASAPNQEAVDEDPLPRAQSFVNEEKEILSAEDALSGARHILSEIVNED